MMKISNLVLRSAAYGVVGPIDLALESGVTALLGRPKDGVAALMGVFDDSARVLRGSIALDGVSWSTARRKLAFVARAPALPSGLKVREVLEAMGRARGTEPSPETILRSTGMAALLGVRTDRLAPEQVKGVLVAEALAGGARFVLLDEPFSAMDAATAERLPALFQAAATDGKCVLFSTASVREAQVSGRVGVFAPGRLASGHGVQLVESGEARFFQRGGRYRLELSVVPARLAGARLGAESIVASVSYDSAEANTLLIDTEDPFALSKAVAALVEDDSIEVRSMRWEPVTLDDLHAVRQP